MNKQWQEKVHRKSKSFEKGQQRRPTQHYQVRKKRNLWVIKLLAIRSIQLETLSRMAVKLFLFLYGVLSEVRRIRSSLCLVTNPFVSPWKWCACVIRVQRYISLYDTASGMIPSCHSYIVEVSLLISCKPYVVIHTGTSFELFCCHTFLNTSI